MKGLTIVFILFLILPVLLYADTEEIEFYDINTLIESAFSTDYDYWYMIDKINHIIDNPNMYFSSSVAYVPLIYSPNSHYQFDNFLKDQNVLSKSKNITLASIKKYLTRQIAVGKINKTNVLTALDKLSETCNKIDFNAKTTIVKKNNIDRVVFSNPDYEKNWSYLQKFLFRRGREITNIVNASLTQIKQDVLGTTPNSINELEYSFNDFETLCLFLGDRKLDETYDTGERNPFSFSNFKDFLEDMYSIADQPPEGLHIYHGIYNRSIIDNIKQYFLENPPIMERAVDILYNTSKTYCNLNLKKETHEKEVLIKVIGTLIKTINEIDFSAKVINTGNHFNPFYEFVNPEHREWNKLKKFFFRCGKRFSELVKTKLNIYLIDLKR